MEITHSSPPTDRTLVALVPLLARARRDYDAALQRGDLDAVRCCECAYQVLFERRRRALLVQAAQRRACGGGVA
jgi:hypothetical protein